MSSVSPLLAEGFAGDLPTLRWLQVACGMSWREAARFCLVSPETYRRWRSDRRPNPTAVRLLAVRAGYLPWPEWRGWEMHGGRLMPPGLRDGGYSPADLLANPLWRQLADVQARELEQLRRQAAQLADYPRTRRRA